MLVEVNWNVFLQHIHTHRNLTISSPLFLMDGQVKWQMVIDWTTVLGGLRSLTLILEYNVGSIIINIHDILAI